MGMEGAGCCHLGGGVAGHWLANMGASGGLVGALLGSWAEPAAHGGGSLPASGGGNLAPATILTTRPCPPIPFDTRSWLFARLGCCCSLAARGCPSSHAVTGWAMPFGESAKWDEALGPWRASGRGGCGEGGVADPLPRPHRLRPAVALPATTLLPPQPPLY